MVIAAAASVATGGTSLAVPAKLGLDIGVTAGVGAAYKNLVAATFEGDDYDLSEFDDNAVSGAVVAVLNRVDILKVLAEPEGAAAFAAAVKGEARTAAAGEEAVRVVAAKKAASELPTSVTEAATGVGTVDNVATQTQPANSVVDDINNELWKRSNFTPDEPALGTEDSIVIVDRSYDDIESSRAASYPTVVDEVAPPKDSIAIADRSYDDLENARAAAAPIVVDDTVRFEEPLPLADDSYNEVEAARAASAPIVFDDTARFEEPLPIADDSYDQVEAARADYPPIVVDDTARVEEQLAFADDSYDEVEAARAASSPIVVDDTARVEEPLAIADDSYNQVEAARAASSSTRSAVMESTVGETTAKDSTSGLRVRYPWGKYALRAATTKGSSRVATPTALVTAENLSRREETNQSSENADVVIDQEETTSETSETAKSDDKKFFTGEEVNINGRIAHRLEDGSYAFIIPEGDTLFVIRNDIVAAMGEATIKPGDAVYTDEMILALKAANKIGDPDLIYTGNQFVIPVEVINASQ